jgi:hypothetical protein
VGGVATLGGAALVGSLDRGRRTKLIDVKLGRQPSS